MDRPPVRRTPLRTLLQEGSHSSPNDNNTSYNSQVNVLDVQSTPTPSTFNTSLCTLNVLSAEPPGSPVVAHGTLTDPWKGMNRLELSEEDEFPLPTNHGPVLNLFENTYEFHIREYQELIRTQCSTEFLSLHPEFMALFLSEDVTDLVVPKTWSGIKGITPIKLTFSDDLQKTMRSHRRNISPKLMENAKAEFFRLKQYIYVNSESHIASPLVIAPNATSHLYASAVITKRSINSSSALPTPSPTR